MSTPPSRSIFELSCMARRSPSGSKKENRLFNDSGDTAYAGEKKIVPIWVLKKKIAVCRIARVVKKRKS
jgi:hypothetical protein